MKTVQQKTSKRTPKAAPTKPSKPIAAAEPSITAAPEPSPALDGERDPSGRMSDDLDFRVEIAQSLVNVVASAIKDEDVLFDSIDQALFVLGEELHAIKLRTRAIVQGPEPFAADARVVMARSVELARDTKEVA